jgi:hypothetical protein
MSAGLSALELEVIAACLNWVVRSGTKNTPFVPAGKSLLIFRTLQAPESKIFRFTFLEIRIITSPVSRPQEGRIMIVTTRGARDAVDAFVQARFWRADE